jgi:hypothetical protein
MNTYTSIFNLKVVVIIVFKSFPTIQRDSEISLEKKPVIGDYDTCLLTANTI